jgi:hypothetical protein
MALPDLDQRVLVCAVVDMIRREREAYERVGEPSYWRELASEYAAISQACRNKAAFLERENDE